MGRKSLIYGVFRFNPDADDGMIVFFEKTDAEVLAKTWAAIRSSKTWKEFREKCPRKQYRDVMVEFDYRGDPRPRGDAPFDPTEVPLTSEEWSPVESMVDFLPERAVAFGTRADTPGMGDWVSFEPKQETELIKMLKSCGVRVERDDALARRAGGDWIDSNFA